MRFKHVLFFKGIKCFKYGAVLMSFILLFSFLSCSDSEPSRSQYLVVSDTLSMEPVFSVYCQSKGGLDTLYVYTNEEFNVEFQTADRDESWVSIEKTEEVSNDFLRLVLRYTPVTEMTARTGMLNFSIPDFYLGQYIKFTQGFTNRFKDDFGWLIFGSRDPFDETGETLWANWQSSLQAKGWISTIMEDDNARLYGKNGLLKLGDAEFNADVISPYVTNVLSDSILMLEFKAVAYTSPLGVKDNDELTITVLNGGLFANGTDTEKIKVGHFDHTSENLIASMWDNKTFKLFLEAPKGNEFTQKLSFRFFAGNEEGTPNRIYLDDVNVYRVGEGDYYLLDEAREQ